LGLSKAGTPKKQTNRRWALGGGGGRARVGRGGWWPQIGVLVSTSVGRFSNPDPVFTVKTGWHG